MTLGSLTGIVASCSGVLMALSPLLQARRVHAAGDSSEVSAALFFIIGANAAVWLTHAIVTSDPFLMVPNVVAITASTVTVTIVRRHRHGLAAAPAVAPSRPPRARRLRDAARPIVRRSAARR